MTTKARRDWTDALDKVRREAACRTCGHRSWLEAAHIIPRSRISAQGGGEDERNIVPLCRDCHTRYDQARLDLLPLLTREEQAHAVSLVGLVEAYRRITGQRL